MASVQDAVAMWQAAAPVALLQWLGRQHRAAGSSSTMSTATRDHAAVTAPPAFHLLANLLAVDIRPGDEVPGGLQPQCQRAERCAARRQLEQQQHMYSNCAAAGKSNNKRLSC